ncbi:MAG: hypothetical protein JO107_07400 [Hyphomicrobiales bacterium]|nr:hypothetical protein [Hyphomicrobiales bacterium]
MSRLCIAALALLSVSSAALAQYAPDPAYPWTITPQAIAFPESRSMSFNPDERYVRNPNTCGMELSQAVWGLNGTLLGYVCYRNPNG